MSKYYIDVTDYQERLARVSMALRTYRKAVEIADDMPTIEAIPKDQYETRLKADMVAMLTDIQLEIKELWDNRYDVWLDNQYYIGKSDTLEEVDEVIQQKIDKLKEVDQ